MTRDRLGQTVHSALAEAIRGGRPPFLAVLGPPAAGKTALLTEMRRQLPLILPGAVTVPLDLRLLAVGSPESMAAALERALHTTDFGTRVPGTALGGRAIGEFLALVLLAMLRECAGHLVLFIDHLDAVPRHFARSLIRTIRHCFESSNSVDDYRRFGVVAAGALSLFELKRAADSAFSMFDTFRLPVVDIAEQRQFVEQRMSEEGLTYDISAIEALVEETGGEPAFLDAVVQALSENVVPFGRSDVCAAAERLCAIDSGLPELRHLAIAVSSDRELSEVIVELLANRPAYPREPNADVDRLQLTGAVVLAREGGRRAYRMRNGMVRRYLSAVLAVIADRYGTAPSLLREARGRAENARHPRDSIADYEWIAYTERNIAQADDIWLALTVVQRAWSKLTTFEAPELSIAMPVDAARSAWLVHVDRACIAHDGSGRIAHATVTAAAGAEEMHRPYFGWSDDQVAVAVPLGNRRQDAVLVATLPRASLITGLSESSLRYWLHVVTANARPLSLLACEAIYRSVHNETQTKTIPRVFAPGTTNTEPLDVFVAMPFDKSLGFVYQDHIAKICKRLHVSVLRGDDLFTAQGIMSDVFAAISRARVTIADCTGRNPNVFYEVGLAHAIDKPVILTTQAIEDIPFDLRHLRFIQYEPTSRGMKEYESVLAATIRSTLQLKQG